MPYRSALLGALATLAFGLTTFAPTAQAQGSPEKATKTVSLDVTSVDLREALRAIFKQAGVSYTIDANLKGIVTADFRSVALEDALRIVLRQVDGRYRIDGGVYMIVAPQTVDIFIRDPTYSGLILPPPEPPAMTVDGGFLYVYRQGEVVKIDKKTMKVIGRVSLGQITFR